VELLARLQFYPCNERRPDEIKALPDVFEAHIDQLSGLGVDHPGELGKRSTEPGGWFDIAPDAEAIVCG
jgi:hypothetical protein